MNIIYLILNDIKKYWTESCGIALLIGGASAILYILINVLTKKEIFSSAFYGIKIVGRSIWVTLLIIYEYLLCYITLFMRPLGYRQEVNLIPFSSIDIYGVEFRFVIENIFLFIPFGILTPLCFAKLRKVYRTISLALLISIFIEVAQYILKNGKTEVDDVILNVFGTLIGYFIFYILRFLLKSVTKNIEVHTRRE